MSSVLESTYQAHILRAVNAPERQTRLERQNVLVARPCKCGRLVRIRTGANEGAGDLSGFVAPEGFHIEVEIKGAATRVEPRQKQRAKALARAGAIYVLVRYDASLELGANVARALAAIDAAIDARRQNGRSVKNSSPREA